MHQLVVECPSMYEMFPNPEFKWEKQPEIQVWRKQSEDGETCVKLESYDSTNSFILFEEALGHNEPVDIYLIDEPSAYLDSEQRIVASKVIKRFILHAKKTAFVVEHDFIMATYLVDRVIVYEGRPSVDCTANTPQSLLTGMNFFLSAYFNAPDGDEPLALDMGSMGKGQVWINGQSIGRYWTAFATGNCNGHGEYGTRSLCLIKHKADAW